MGSSVSSQLNGLEKQFMKAGEQSEKLLGQMLESENALYNEARFATEFHSLEGDKFVGGQVKKILDKSKNSSNKLWANIKKFLVNPEVKGPVKGLKQFCQKYKGSIIVGSVIAVAAFALHLISKNKKQQQQQDMLQAQTLADIPEARGQNLQATV